MSYAAKSALLPKNGSFPPPLLQVVEATLLVTCDATGM